ncbi:MAG TPA: hypothetical protein VGN57_09385 [Pirellulaceae bacterium]|nr:hypothetical protein [Pirellulaceae bacterium]
MKAAPLSATLERSRRPRSLRLVQRIRLAARLAEQYAECERRTEPPSPPEAGWRRLSDQASLLRRSGQRSSRALAALERRATDFQSEFDSYVERLRAFARRPPAPTFRDLYAELLALEEEFGEAEIDLQGKTLSVVTELIELEEVELGRFRIVLDCSAVERAEYDVVALSANEPSSSDFAKVTHPHVRDEGLCEGEAHEPIRAALKQGRLSDFFAIVDRTLKTYNPGSAYARLSEWDGQECQDCGCRTTDDLSCSRCGDSTCSDCSRSCSGCDCDLCAYCAQECSGCEERFCSDCLAESSSSGRGLCTSCLQERENEREADEQESEDQGESEESDSQPAVHAVRLGEADVSA